jgi:hypothetical protein
MNNNCTPDEKNNELKLKEKCPTFLKIVHSKEKI